MLGIEKTAGLRRGTFLPNGEAIRWFRARKALTQSDLAELAGVSKRTIERLENNKPVTVVVLGLLAEALEVTIDQLLAVCEPATHGPEAAALRGLEQGVSTGAPLQTNHELHFANNNKWQSPSTDIRDNLRFSTSEGTAECLRNLKWTYGRDIGVTRCELSSSIVVRSEQQFNCDERRLSLRTHLYEVLKATPRGRGPVRSYQPAGLGNQFGQYLGFVDLRTEWEATPLALGLLAVPKKYAVDPATQLIVGNYGPLFGGASFAASVYSMHDTGLGGGACAQAAIMMTLAMLADRGGRLDESQPLTFRGRARSQHPPGISFLPECVSNHPIAPPAERYTVGGLDAEDCLTILRNPIYKVSPTLITGTDRKRFPDRLICTIVQAYLNARFPVILGVDAYRWFARDLASGRLTDKRLAPGTDAHTVVIIGYRAIGHGSTDMEWIFHDPSDRPYILRRADVCLEAAWGYTKKAVGNSGRLILLPVADDQLRVHLAECVEWLRSPAARSFFRRRAKWAPPAETADLWERRRELEGLAETFERYAAPQAGTEEQYELRAGLIDPSACDLFFKYSNERSPLRGLLGNIGALPGQRYWCLAGYEITPPSAPAEHPSCPAPTRLRYVWLFNAEHRGDNTAHIGHGRPERWLELALWVVGADVIPIYGPFANHLWLPTAPLEPITEPSSISPIPLPSPLGQAWHRPLAPAIMTSCSAQPLREVVAIAGDHMIDVLLLRQNDLNDFLRSRNPGDASPNDRSATALNPVTQFLAEATPRDCEGVAVWIAAQFGRPTDAARHPIAALSSYLPGVTSLTEATRMQAVRALANCVRIGFRLADAGLMRDVIVELVCGSLIDRCICPACQPDGRDSHLRRHVNTEFGKVDLLLRSLEEVVASVSPREGARQRFALSLELEPGITSVLNGIPALRRAIAGVTTSRTLSEHVGLNLDIAHMRIADIEAAELAEFVPRIVHARIADHPPGIHTSDQPPGSWTPVYTPDSPYLPFMRLLAERARHYQPGKGLPFSGSVALELEGCDRVDWIHQSVPAMQHLAGVVSNRP